MQEQLKQKDSNIGQLNVTIDELRSKIDVLEDKLNLAMQSGDEATNKLRRQLHEL